MTASAAVDWELAVRIAAAAAAIVAYAGLQLPRRAGDAVAGRVRRALEGLPLARRHSPDALENLWRLALAGILQLGLAAALLVISGVALDRLLPDRFHALRIVYGLVLGVGEGVLASFAAAVGIEAANAFSRGPALQREQWLVLARGGWMRRFLRAGEILPWYGLLPLAVFYVAVEEAIYRGILVNELLPLGAGWALAGSLALFLFVQAPQMPSWQSALFPVLGALVIGVVHGALYLAVADLTPLVAAHCVLVSMTVLFPGERPTVRRAVL